MKESFIYFSNQKREQIRDEGNPEIKAKIIHRRKIIDITTAIIILITFIILIMSIFDAVEIVKHPEGITRSHKTRYFFKMILFIIISICLVIIPGKKLDLKIVQFIALFYTIRYFLIYFFLEVRSK